ncbi:MAG: O-methyltransferase [Hyphomicrobiaceae bacterium]
MDIQEFKKMSAAGLPYRLRPNKFVDRELFLDIISRVVSARGPRDYAYISMGGAHLVDHFGIFRRTGIEKLYAFDEEDNTVERQKTNKPFDRVECRCHGSNELAGRYEQILNDLGAEKAVIWLDYTRPKQRLSQLQEVESIAKKLIPGDVLRVTLNADTEGLQKLKAQLPKGIDFATPNEEWAALLRQQLGEFVPADLDGFTATSFPSALARCIEAAISSGLAQGDEGATALPLLSTTYQDTSRMLSVTVLIRRDDEEGAAPPHWEFLPNGWGDVINIDAPDLSLREKSKLDSILHLGAKDAADTLGFFLGDSRERSEATIGSYTTFRRYYPSFFNVEA